MVTVKVLAALFLQTVSTTALTVFDRNIRVEYKISNHTKCLDRSQAYVVKVGVTLGECVKDCGGRSDCLALNYKQQFHLCELFLFAEGDFIKKSRQTGQCIFIKKDYMKVAISQRFAEPSLVCDCQNGKKCDKANNICVSPVCPKISFENAAVSGNMNDVGSSIEYKCQDGYIAEMDEMQSTCLANETWSYQPKCRKAYKCHVYSPEERTYARITSEKETCERLGYVFTQGNNEDYPGCNHCWCCKPV